ncbi:DNA invertase Pin-like site-specific DNA recombinase [Acidocella aromatica]|uniref:DNA invertase Pin-like site-specific DNA recombinase n=2 Tax=Acidocella aromatica TaxID=1303579 RepID=A0A840V9Q6_9PROT|nr:DNA invertase Pin-like site-specific DNA recombinase [Acidocella aromatica]
MGTQVAGFESQLEILEAAGCERIFSEQVSSVSRRDKLEEALRFVRDGDTLVATKPDRVARSTRDLLDIVDQLARKGVGLRILSMGGMELDTKQATSKLMLTVLGAIAEFERALMLERQREGIKKAAEEGKYKGRAPTARRKEALIVKLRGQGVKPTDIAKQLDISRASVYRVLASAA